MDANICGGLWENERCESGHVFVTATLSLNSRDLGVTTSNRRLFLAWRRGLRLRTMKLPTCLTTSHRFPRKSFRQIRSSKMYVWEHGILHIEFRITVWWICTADCVYIEGDNSCLSRGPIQCNAFYFLRTLTCWALIEANWAHCSLGSTKLKVQPQSVDISDASADTNLHHIHTNRT